jgi:hypothetical protein
VIAFFGGLRRPVINSFGHVNAVAFFHNVFAVTFGATVIKTHRFVVVAVARVVTLRCVGGDSRSHPDPMLRVEEAIDFALPAAASMSAGLFIAILLAYDNRSSDWTFQWIDFFQHAFLQDF